MSNGCSSPLLKSQNFVEHQERDARSLIRSGDEAIEVFQLSKEVRGALTKYLNVAHMDEGNGERNQNGISKALFQALHESEILCKEPSPLHRMVFKWNGEYVIKLKREMGDFTEYTSLMYLAKHAADIPAPRPHGIVKMSGLFIIFMTYVPSITLENTWHKLNKSQKSSIRDQLDRIFIRLRSLPFPAGFLLGGVAGEGCKDLRRHLRRNKNQIVTSEEFVDFLFSDPHYGSSVYIQFLRELLPTIPSNYVFTHGDLRPDNIIVEFSSNNQCTITSIIDWEYSGFYPEYYESLKVTNCMATNEKTDWYLYLPPSISPRKHPVRWLVDRLWDQHIA